MEVHRKKSLNDINEQTMRLMSMTNDPERWMKIQRIGWKYMDGIRDSKSYRRTEAKAEDRDENGYTKGQLSPNRLLNNADNRKYSIRTYGRYTGIAKAVGGKG